MPLQSKKSPDPLAPPILRPPFLSADEIRARTFVRHIELHDQLDSTNNRAIDLARDTNIGLPALIIARLQTAGRGRGNNKWRSADGALTFSLLLDPAAHSIAIANWPQLSLTTAVALCDALESSCATGSASALIHASIKWPNDVLVEGRKIAGILLESPGGATPANNRLIIGIGINVNNSWRNPPPDATANGIALCDIVDRKHDLQELLIALLDAIASRINQLASADNRLIRAWQRRNQLAGKNVTAENNGQITQGQCVEIAVDGALVIDTPRGRKRVVSGSIRPTA
jgi:BirA family transcriptional regulator, biotin operon repressor / biotin---[acetyl-CoA-carboxylase] ligase